MDVPAVTVPPCGIGFPACIEASRRELAGMTLAEVGRVCEALADVERGVWRMGL